MTIYNVPDGTQLHPSNPCDLGAPKPSDIKYVGDKLWVTLANLDASYQPAGPGFLLEIDPATGVQTLHELTGCFNPQGIAAFNTDLLVACTNNYFDPGNVVRFDTTTHAITHTYATGGAPGVVAVGGTLAYMNDGLGLGVMVVDLAAASDATAVLVSSATESTVCAVGAFPYVSGLAYSSTAGLMLATCFDAAGGQLVEVSASGLLTGTPLATEAGPVAVKYLGSDSDANGRYDRFAILNTVAATVQYATVHAASFTLDAASVSTGAGTSPNGLSGYEGSLFVANSHTNEVLRLFGGNPGVTASLPSGSDPYAVAWVSDNTAWTTLQLTAQVAKVDFP